MCMPVVEQPAASRKSTGLPPAAKRAGSMTRLIACCVCACLESQISRLSGSFLLVSRSFKKRFEIIWFRITDEIFNPSSFAIVGRFFYLKSNRSFSFRDLFEKEIRNYLVSNNRNF